MKKFVFTSFVLVFLLSSFTTLHKYYVSLSEINYVEDKKSIQIISRVFIDDFEKMLRERYDDEITLAIENEKETAKFYTKKYLKEKFKIIINEKEVEFRFLGKKYEDDIMLCYMEIENIDHISSIQIENKILFDIFSEQQNIVRLKINDRSKSFLLTKENDKGMLKF